MGGSSKSQTVGYKYYLGMHQALCHGPVDKLVRVRVDKRCAWVGDLAGGRVNLNAPSLFGGESREGGVSGAIDFEPGASDQGQNDYLASKISADVPNFRGVCAAVLRQVYCGMNPYLKAWDWRVQRIHTRQNGIAQWYDAKAEIPAVTFTGGQAIALCVDYSGSQMIEVSPGVTRLDLQNAAIKNVLQSIKAGLGDGSLHLAFIPFAWKTFEPYARYHQNVTAAQVDALIVLVDNVPINYNYGTAYNGSLLDAKTFFDSINGTGCLRRTCVFVTDGDPWQDSLAPADTQYQDMDNGGITVYAAANIGRDAATAIAVTAAQTLWSAGISVYAFNTSNTYAEYTAQISNTQPNGIPVLQPDSDVIAGAIQGAITVGMADMNPAHIIRECLTDPNWGMGYPEADMDDGAFQSAADTLFSEQMGISIIWDRQIPLDDFIREILKHIDAVLYVDRTTGKFVLKLIRDDYDAGTLLVLNEDNCERVDAFKTPALGELVNSITINYWDTATGNDASLTVHDTALAQLQGGVVNTTVEYPGFTNGAIAARIAARDLKSLSTPIVSCTIYANREASGLNVGDVFKLQWPEFGLAEMVMRVTAMAYGDGKNNRIRIQASQDVFSLPEAFVAEPPSTGWSNPVSMPAPSPNRLVIEAPYYEVVQQMGQAETDAELASNPERGYLLVAGDRPSTDAIHAVALITAGAGYAESGVVDFAPSATLSADVGAADTTLPITAGVDMDLIVVGSHAQLGNELVRVDSVGTSSLTVGRGCLDTVPMPHAAGTVILAWDRYAFSDQVEYADGETLAAKLLTVTGLGQLGEAFAPAESVTMDQRAIRPYPPGQFKVNDAYFPTVISGQLAVSWVHRDRLQQTAGDLIDHTYGSIGPEAGTTYTLRIYGEAGALLRTISTAGISYTYAISDEQDDSGLVIDIVGVVQRGTVLTASDAAGSDNFGWAVALSSDATVLAVGAHNWEGASGTNRGGVYIYDWSGSAWVQRGSVLEASDAADTDNFGVSVALSSDGTVLAVGAHNWEGASGSDRGGVYIYDWSGSAWVQRGSVLEASDAADSDGFGISVALNSNGLVIVVGAFLRDGTSADQGGVYTHDYYGGYRINGRLRIELESVRDGLTSYQHHDHTVYRPGYGFNYGMFYGGV